MGEFAINPEGGYLEDMDQEEEPEMGRFDPKGEPPGEPVEPFLPDEMLEPGLEPEVPSIKSLHVPSAPVTKEVLKNFLIELKPFIHEIHAMSRQDQHLVGKYLQDVKNAMKVKDFSEDVVDLFDQVVNHFNELLTHSRPIDQDETLKTISVLESKL